jgi:15-cis-phytoene synthase
MPSQPTSAQFLHPHSSLFLAIRTSGNQRPTIEAWLRWWHEVSKTPYEVSDPAVAERKLAWWAKAVTLSFEMPPQHPVLKAIAPGSGVLTGPPIDLWLSQLQALSELSGQTRWMDDTALERHIDASTGAACQSITWLMGAREEETLKIARNMAQGLRRAHLLFRLGQDAKKGWLHIPIDCLQKHDVKAHELLRPAPAPHPIHVLNLLEAWQQDAKQRLLSAIDEAKTLPREEKRFLKPLVVLSRLHLQLLEDLQKQHFPMLHQRVSVGPWRKLWISRKAAWTWF